MKNLSIFSMAVLTTLTIFSTSCKKDDDASPSTPTGNTGPADYMHFDAEDRITLNSPLTGNAQFTIETNFKSEATDAVYRRLIGWSGFGFELADVNGTLYYYVTSWTATSATNLRDGNWHHLAAVNDGSNLTIYLDGLEVYQSTNPLTFSFSGSMGVGNKTNGFSEGWIGCIDEVKVWDQALSQYEVWTSMGEVPDTSDTNLALYYDFHQETSDTAVIDLSQSSLHGVIEGESPTHNGPDFQYFDIEPDISAPRGEYLSFDGGDLVSTTSPITTNTFTIETKFNTTTNETNYRRLIGHSGYELEIALYNGGIVIYDGSWRTTTGTGVADGNWHHTAVTLNDTVLTVYVDGDTVLTRTANYNLDFTGLAMAVGARTSGSEAFIGSLDDVRIWSTARTDTEIASLVNSDLSGTESGLLLNYKFSETAISQIIEDSAMDNDGVRGTNNTIQASDPTYNFDVPADIIF